MMRSAVTISLVNEARGGPFVFWDDLAGGCRTAAEFGFDAVEVFPPAADAVDPHALKQLLVDHHLTLAAVGTGAGWVRGKLHLTLPDAEKRAAAKAFIKSIIDLAGPLGAPAIIGTVRAGPAGQVTQRSVIGAERIVDRLSGEQLPRIC